MRITIVTVGSRGDIEPFIALGLGLQHAGHEVTVATHDTFETVIVSRGLRFLRLQGNPREILERDEGQAWLRTGGNPLSFIGRLSTIMLPLIIQMLRDTEVACRDADAVVYSVLGGLAAYHVVEKHGLRFVPAFLQPATPTREFPSPSFPGGISLGGRYNRWTYSVTEQLLWRMMAKALNRARLEVFGLPPLAKAWYSEAHKRQIPVVYGYSPSVLPKPLDWGEWVHVTGYWFLDPPAGWKAPGELVDFLAAGPPPVCIGFGSMADRDQGWITETVQQALALANCRGVLVSGWGGLAKVAMPGDVFNIDDVPFSWLLPQAAAVVHHAGAGTMAAGIRAGLPTVAVPFFSDQPFWAQRAYRLGIGPKPIARRKLSAERLAEAIRLAVNDEDMRRRAAALGVRVRQENGVERAVETIEKLVGR